MTRYILSFLVLAMLAMTGSAYAGYDIRNVNILDVTTMLTNDVTDNDYVQVMRVTNTAVGSGDSEKIPLAQLVDMVETLAATNTLTTADCGKTLILSAATEFATTLPAPTSGCKLHFFVGNAPESASYTVVTASSSNVMIGGFNELEVDTGDDGPYSAAADTITFVDSVSVVGDFVEMISDGTSWYLHGQTNADGGATIAGS